MRRASFLFAARVIPYRGSWLDFEFDAKDIVNVRIDRKRKLPVTSLLYTLGDTVFQIDDVVNAPAVGETVRIAGHFPAKVEEFDGKYLRVSGLHGAVSDGQYITRDGERDKDVGVIKRVVSRGMNSEQILNEFYGRVTWVRGQGGWIVPFEAEQWRGTKPSFDVVNAETGEVAFPLGTKITPRLARKAQTDGLKELLIPTEEIFGRYSAYDLINEKTGEIYIEAGDELTEANLANIDKSGVDRVELLDNRSRQRRAVDPQHADGRQGRRPRPCAERNLPRHAPR